MRLVSGEDLVTAALQASLGRAQKNHKKFEFDLWKQRASELTFTTEGYISGAKVPSNIECLSDTKMKDATADQLPLPKRILYPKEKVIPGYVDKVPVGAGFYNMGNSCYLNATLQAVFHVPAFINWIRQDVEHMKQCQDMNCIVCAMKKTLESAIQSSAVRPIRPVEIINRLRSICRHFSHGRQEDAHEFLRYLFESMEKSYLAAIDCQRLDNRSKETTPLGQIFGGYLRTEVTCLKCNHVSTTFQPTAELQLDIRHVTTLEDAISTHFKKERLDNNDYKCEKCRTISQATKQFSLEVPPIVLCLQLKRFTLFGTKITKRIHCNQYLDMSKYMHRPEQRLRYRFVALVTHLGSSPNCGHYTAIAQAANGNFYQFDDSLVHQVSLTNALNNDAYVIIYELDNKSKKSPELSPKASSSESGSNFTSNMKFSGPSASSSPINSIFPKKHPSSTPISKLPTSTPTQPSQLVQKSDSGSKATSTSVNETTTLSSPSNGNVLVPGANASVDTKLNMERKKISYGIMSNGVTKSGGSKINILKQGHPLTKSSQLSNSRKLVPYESEESDTSDTSENPKENETSKTSGKAGPGPSQRSSLDHDNSKREREHRDSFSQERERERKRARNPSRSRSRSPNSNTDRRDRSEGTPFDVSRLKNNSSK